MIAARRRPYPVEGGTLTATGADGTTYTLDIPGDALLAETEIRLTPVQSLDGLPFGEGTAFAVQMSTGGIDFQQLRHTDHHARAADPAGRANPVRLRERDGQALGLALPALDPNIIQIQLLHFSGAGVSKGLLADTEPVRQRLGGSVEARLNSAMAIAVQQARQNGESAESPAAKLSGYIDEFIEKVVKPRLAAAGESCAAGDWQWTLFLATGGISSCWASAKA